MNKKNAYIRTTLLLLCITTTPSFYLRSSAYKAPGTRGRDYTGPKRLRQKPRISIAPAQVAQPAQATVNAPAPIAAPATVDQSNQPVEKPQAEQPTVASQAMQAQAARQQSSPGWLATAYIVFLSTLHKAFGGSLELGYKPLAQNFMQRQIFLALKDDAQSKATKMVQSGDFAADIRNAIAELKDMELSPMDPKYLQRAKAIENFNRLLNSTDQEQINKLTKDLLKDNKIDIDKMEKQTSFGSMAKDAMYLGLFNTATRVIGGLIGFGATMLLQSLMPTQSE